MNLKKAGLHDSEHNPNRTSWIVWTTWGSQTKFPNRTSWRSWALLLPTKFYVMTSTQLLRIPMLQIPPYCINNFDISFGPFKICLKTGRNFTKTSCYTRRWYEVFLFYTLQWLSLFLGVRWLMTPWITNSLLFFRATFWCLPSLCPHLAKTTIKTGGVSPAR